MLLDIHPTDEPSALEVWWATGQDASAPVSADNLDSVQRAYLGPLDHDPETRRDFTAATDALAASLDNLFDLSATRVFEYQYFFDSLDELTDYFEDNHEHARASDELLERAVSVLKRAPHAARLVIVQRTLVTALRKF
jgi:hypothetical protein